MGKDVTIYAPVADSSARAPMENIQHHCPFCGETFGWVEFQTHAKGCIEAHPEKVREIQKRGE